MSARALREVIENIELAIVGYGDAPFFVASDRFHTLVRRHGITRKELAAESELHGSTISRLFSGYAVQPHTARAVVRALFDVIARRPDLNLDKNEFSALFEKAKNKRDSRPSPGQPDFGALLEVPIESVGARWHPGPNSFEIDRYVSDSDAEVALAPVVRQMHRALQRKVAYLSDLAVRLDNLVGWTGLRSAVTRFKYALDRDISDIPSMLGDLYDAMLEIASFVEQDDRLRDERMRGALISDVEPLQPDISRALNDFVRTSAPWMRQFPSIRKLDDEAGAFLARPPLVSNSQEILHAASINKLIERADAERLIALSGAHSFGDIQGKKASVRTIGTTRNLLFAVIAVVYPLYFGAVSSEFANHSVLAQRGARTLAAVERQALEIADGLSPDLRVVLREFLREMRQPRSTPQEVEHPVLPTQD